MSRVEEMRSTTEHLMHSYRERVAMLGARHADVREFLANQHATRAEAATAQHLELAADHAARHATVTGTLVAFNSGRSEIAAHLRTTLTKVTADRRAEVSAARSRAQHGMREVHTARVANETALFAKLKRDRGDRLQQTHGMLQSMHQAHATMAARQIPTSASACVCTKRTRPWRATSRRCSTGIAPA
ncbi:MAG: hypothetical protein M1118_16030 [Chloroflexi bacterium]|nr:hypothetical protein [Chloroflexota bacterium]